MKFLNKYKEYKQKYTIYEGSIKSILNILQDSILDASFENSHVKYKDLSPEDQQYVNNSLIKLKDLYQTRVEELSNNKQYQSWIYDRIANYDISLSWFTEKLSLLRSLFNKFENLCKSSKLNSDQKNIMSYKSINELSDFIENNQNLLITKDHINFKKVYTNSEYDIYAIYEKDKEQFQKVYGDCGYDCGWCVVNPERTMFEYYLKGKTDCYYLWTFKGTNRPFALLHFKSGQFKNIHNDVIAYDSVKNDTNVMDGLFNITTLTFNKFKQFKQDLYPFNDTLNKKIHDKLNDKYGSPGETFAKLYKLKYDSSTNSVDCNDLIKSSTQVQICNFINDQGSLDFILKNINNLISFSECCRIKTLPDGCTFDQELKSCGFMFAGCTNLEYLPTSLQLPINVTDCQFMFDRCISLKEIPNIFIGANKIQNYTSLFRHCSSIIEVPQYFKLSDNTKSCGYLFEDCKNLINIPKTFILPKSVQDTRGFIFGCVKLNEQSYSHVLKQIVVKINTNYF